MPARLAPRSYLESIDSVRLPWETWAHDANRRRDRLQVYNEVMITLALGERVIVPQPFVLDSLLFAQVAWRVLTARAELWSEGHQRNPVHPFVVHCFGHADMRSAAADIIRRGNNPDNPFHFSLLPDLKAFDPRLVEHVAAELEMGSRAALHPILDPEPATWMDTVLGEMLDPRSDDETVVSFTPGVHPTPPLDELARRILEEGAVAEEWLDAAPDRRNQVERLRHAVRAIDEHRLPDGRSLLSTRSLLRPFGPPDAPQDPAREALDGDGELLALVHEYVDTLYNVVIVASNGGPPATYTTAVLDDAGLVAARGAAQMVSMAAGRADVEQLAEEPLFQIVKAVDHRLVRTARGLTSEDVDRLEDVLVQGIKAVLSLWGEDDFEKSVRRVQRVVRYGALPNDDADSIMAEHLDLVAQRITERVGLSTSRLLHGAATAAVGLIAGVGTLGVGSVMARVAVFVGASAGGAAGVNMTPVLTFVDAKVLAKPRRQSRADRIAIALGVASNQRQDAR